MPRCKICGNYFVGGNPKHDENICLYCYVKLWSQKTIAEVKAKLKAWAFRAILFIFRPIFDVFFNFAPHLNTAKFI